MLRSGKDMRADWTIRVSDCDGDVEDWFKALTDVKVLGLAADEHRYWFEVARRLARLLARCRTRRFGCDRGFARGANRIKFGLHFGFGGCHRAESSIANALAFFLTSSAFSLFSIDDADVSARSEASNCTSATRSCGDPAKPSRWYGGGRRGSWRRALQG
jgi:hypothetical protein